MVLKIVASSLLWIYVFFGMVVGTSHATDKQKNAQKNKHSVVVQRFIIQQPFVRLQNFAPHNRTFNAFQFIREVKFLNQHGQIQIIRQFQNNYGQTLQQLVDARGHVIRQTVLQNNVFYPLTQFNRMGYFMQNGKLFFLPMQ